MNFQPPPSTLRPEQGVRPQPGAALLELPFLATVSNLVTDRGFGFVQCGSAKDELFLHVTYAEPRRHDFSGVEEGDLILCQLGTSPRRPHKREVVRWVRVADLDWASQIPPARQSDLDSLRREALRDRSFQIFHELLNASWYVNKVWDGNAPADLHDPLLARAWCERLAQLDIAGLREARVVDRLASIPFDFRDKLDPANLRCSVGYLLETFTPPSLTALGSPQSAWLGPAWKPVFRGTDLSLHGEEEQGPLDENQKASILEWFLLSLTADPHLDCEGWLSGSHRYEAVAAQRLLDRGDPMPAPAGRWLVTLAVNGLILQPHVDRMASRNPLVAAQLFKVLSAEGRDRALAAWAQAPAASEAAFGKIPDLTRNIASYCALAVDLEADRARIWEIGCAQGGASTRLYDEKKKTDLAAALADLAVRLRTAPIVVGHNILQWDWPILAQRLKPAAEPLIWDTLLVQYLLEPQAASHALGGTHHAEADAEATLALFARQLARLPATIAAKILTRGFRDTGQLVRAIATSAPRTESIAHPAPAILQDPGHEPTRVLLLADAAIRLMDWVPGVAVVEIDPQDTLPHPYWQIDVKRLAAEIPAEQRQNPFAQVLLAVAERALAEDVRLRRSMVPSWLLEAAPALADAFDRASFIPDVGEGIRLSPMPNSAVWWQHADATTVRALLPEGPYLIVDRGTLRGVGTIPFETRASAILLNVGDAAAGEWVFRDRSRQMLSLEGSWHRFRTVQVPDAMAVRGMPAALPNRLPSLATRRHPALYPGSRDQATYWISVLQSVREAAGSGSVPVLLIGSTASREMLELLTSALAETGLGENKPVHRSRREHLRRAVQHGYGIVDFLDRWSDWQSIASETETALQPVVEALPIEEWFALAEASTPRSTDDQAHDAEDEPAQAPSDPAVVTGARMLEALPDLVERYLGPWLKRTGLAQSTSPALIIDTRVGAVAHQIRRFVDLQPLIEAPWQVDQLARLDAVFSELRITREEAPSDLEAMERFLIRNWQPPRGSGGNAVSGFKPTQKKAMDEIRTRANDVMVALPTGEGKSVLFQVPALCRGLRNRKLTLVISPLKALMRDQVARLHEQDFAESVDYLSSDRPRFELAEVMQGVLDHRIVMLYVAPERLRNEAFLDVLHRRIEADGGLEYVVFDETHCVNQWGHEFRPDYFHAFNHLLQLRNRTRPNLTPFLLLSATLTASDRRSLKGMLAGGSVAGPGLPLKICPDPSEFSNPLRSHIHVEPRQVRGNISDSQDFSTALAERVPHIVEVIQKAQTNRATTGQRSAVIVFAGRRGHADEVARRLASALTCEVESFHAGLDSATRDDIYNRFRDGELDVLVATKAFGMGMDIPDIHWVVHLSPPAYLEDYLQEVGRIGRGVNERKRAGLERLSAVMLSSPSDFETMRNMRATNELRAPQIKDLETKIVKIAQTIEGRKVAIVPQHGFEDYKSASQMRANETRVRMALHWLEKAEHIQRLGMVADLVTIEVFPKKLAEIGAEQSVLGAVARAITSVGTAQDDNPGQRHDASASREGEGLIGALVGWLSNMIGLRVDPPSTVEPTASEIPPASEAVVNLSQIRMQCGIPAMGDVMACLSDLQIRGGLRLRWTLDFAKRPMLSEPDERIETLFVTVGDAVRRLVEGLEAEGKMDFSPFEWLDESDWRLPEPGGPNAVQRKRMEADREALLRRYRRAYLSGFRSLARASGVRLKQSVREDGAGVVWQAVLPSKKAGTARRLCDDLLTMSATLVSIFREAGDEELRGVEVPSMIQRLKEGNSSKRFDVQELEAALRLLSAMSLVSAQPNLVPLCYVLALGDAPVGLDHHPDLVEELNDVNDLAETRTFAMEVFAHLPDRAREGFIGGYFSTVGASALKSFLETQLGEIDDDESSSAFIADKRDQLRATRATEFFAQYKASEEPAQWEAMRHPFDRHLMVNAGPGAGKTSVLVGRIVHLIREQHVKPSEIVVLAFNRAVVFEIKKRIRELFRSLGYAAYAGQVRVSTFHSLALRSLGEADGRDDDARWDGLLQEFAARLSSNERFREGVAGGCRSILVDEYQDATDDVYAIIRELYRGSGGRAGVMVIGDDDQDILRWQRLEQGKKGRRSTGEFAETYFDRFRSDFGGDDMTSLELKVNFRSGPNIVNRSQRFLSTFFDMNKQSRRLKETSLRGRAGATDAMVGKMDWQGKTWEDALVEVPKLCRRLVTDNPGSLAVLCRTNGEVADIHAELVRYFPEITVQSGGSIRVASMRHVGLWIDFLEVEIAKQDRPLSDVIKHDLIATFTSTAGIPETRSNEGTNVNLAALWDLCSEESDFPHLSNLVRFIKTLKTDELQRLLATRRSDREVLVSTIHKIKGLEFDNVVVVPSRDSFGNWNLQDGCAASAVALEKDAVEEARLLYVAITRAKTSVVYFKGDREHSWMSSSPRRFSADKDQRLMLTGAPDQVFLRWAMIRNDYNSDADACQSYIEEKVCVGDPISVGGVGRGAGKGLFHQVPGAAPRQIGFLSNDSGSGDLRSKLKVSAVWRFHLKEFDPSNVARAVAERGWGYAVLVEGRLR